jgi:hypothetical protein
MNNFEEEQNLIEDQSLIDELASLSSTNVEPANSAFKENLWKRLQNQHKINEAEHEQAKNAVKQHYSPRRSEVRLGILKLPLTGALSFMFLLFCTSGVLGAYLFVPSVNKSVKKQIQNVAAKDVPVQFESAPVAAQVMVDGEVKGVTPLNLNLKKGDHDIKLTRDYFTDFNETLNISDKVTSFNFNLNPANYEFAKARTTYTDDFGLNQAQYTDLTSSKSYNLASDRLTYKLVQTNKSQNATLNYQYQQIVNPTRADSAENKATEDSRSNLAYLEAKDVDLTSIEANVEAKLGFAPQLEGNTFILDLALAKDQAMLIELLKQLKPTQEKTIYKTDLTLWSMEGNSTITDRGSVIDLSANAKIELDSGTNISDVQDAINSFYSMSYIPAQNSYIEQSTFVRSGAAFDISNTEFEIASSTSQEMVKSSKLFDRVLMTSKTLENVADTKTPQYAFVLDKFGYLRLLQVASSKLVGNTLLAMDATTTYKHAKAHPDDPFYGIGIGKVGSEYLTFNIGSFDSGDYLYIFNTRANKFLKSATGNTNLTSGLIENPKALVNEPLTDKKIGLLISMDKSLIYKEYELNNDKYKELLSMEFTDVDINPVSFTLNDDVLSIKQTDYSVVNIKFDREKKTFQMVM